MVSSIEDIRTCSAYSVPEAARYLNLPVSTLRSWISGRPYNTKGGPVRSQALIITPEEGGMSFMGLMEAHAIMAFRRGHQVPMRKVRQALDFLRSTHTDHEYPLASRDIWTDGLDLYIEEVEKLVSISERGQLALKDVVRSYAKRIDWAEDNSPLRYYPFSRDLGTDDVRIIAIDPGVSFGKPVIAGTRVQPTVLGDRFRAGDTIQALSGDFDLSPEKVEEAIRWETRANLAQAS